MKQQNLCLKQKLCLRGVLVLVISLTLILFKSYLELGIALMSFITYFEFAKA